MRIGEMFINGKDAYLAWGIYLDSSGVSTLMTPPPNKEYIFNTSPLVHGQMLASRDVDIKLASRDISLGLYFTAPTKETFLNRYNAFCNDILAHGKLDINVKYLPGVVFKCVYSSCSQFQEWMFGLAKFELKLTELNPMDRN